jgi:CDP-glycerol glycerophosphotransferase
MTAHQQFPGRRPLISVVLAVGLVEEFLPSCLDSVLGQPDPPGGAEVVAVDDASPDACGRILDERAAADPRLRVIHLPRSAGPGPARMRGLAPSPGRLPGPTGAARAEDRAHLP